MEYTEKLTRYVANFVDELFRSGLSNVVISPGSRSTPLALTFAEHPDITHWVNMDERSAAFFALGMAKQSKQPVALICTSGTAAANYYPAIVEAHYDRVPLVVLTADRPHELRDVGAPQAIEQIKMYGDYVKWFHEMALPEATDFMLKYVRGKASRAVHNAVHGNPGPVHLNFPFREPLVPVFTLDNLWGDVYQNRAFHSNYIGKRSLENVQLDEIISALRNYKRGLIVCGPQNDAGLAKGIVALAEAYDLPILADPLSQLRAGKHSKANIIECYDSILKSKQVRELLEPEFIIRFGAMPISKPFLLLLKENEHVKQIIIDDEEGHREPTGSSAQFVYADPSKLCEQLVEYKMNFDLDWKEMWIGLNKSTSKLLSKDESDQELSEGGTVRYISEAIPNDTTLYVGNSMPVRDLDTFFLVNTKQITVLGNRGANGIDGITSSALGAAALGKRVTLLIGDLSFFHDFNALLIAKQYHINLTVVLVNNNGGGIFSFLPQAKEQSEHFEVLFGTPLNIDFKPIITMYNGAYHVPNNWDEFSKALTESYDHAGLTVIEVQTNRQENVHWHQAKWSNIEKILLEQLKG
ncbi:2-succinyl-5-enolpyruvyl-6-hydroxy-3-cyclohexene-1-carboxylic-acid synthase [Aquibacillus kalidii]|uniref:2-succinyl-5-enolpyruvyl-6-hydroxy-3- cyclohexene-1-carboxylic-acid synthase n=1 Tax=Aquibacillus kalidii TaxID=2762597 RepID=UPI0016495A38|nr:2-succinyl-5-enolpyruvyl-6-hydroxy-3-cyclohexene-1-carboxylic-acid synthase [Aquibacillus kalidii]